MERSPRDGGDLHQLALHLPQGEGFATELHQLPGASRIGEGENRARLRAEQPPGFGLAGGHRSVGYPHAHPSAIGAHHLDGTLRLRLSADMAERVHLPGAVGHLGVDPPTGESSDPTSPERIVDRPARAPPVACVLRDGHAGRGVKRSWLILSADKCEAASVLASPHARPWDRAPRHGCLVGSRRVAAAPRRGHAWPSLEVSPPPPGATLRLARFPREYVSIFTFFAFLPKSPQREAGHPVIGGQLR